jgi:hypothetical protein
VRFNDYELLILIEKKEAENTKIKKCIRYEFERTQSDPYDID